MQFYKRMQDGKTRQYNQGLNPFGDFYPENYLEELAACLAGHMPRLETLSLFVSYCPKLPDLPHLMHLELRAIRLYGVISAMLRMPALQVSEASQTQRDQNL